MATDTHGFCFEDVSVVVGNGTAILDRVDVAIPGRGLTVIAGPSGSGKSTLLRLCNRLEVPTSGRIRLDGEDISTIDPLALRRRAGMVFQRPVVFGGTVRDNLQVARSGAPDDVCSAVLARAGLGPEVLDRQADDLSGGEAQRLCIARTLLTDPQILLMDEATSALDVDARLVIEKLALDLVASGLTVLWVTHDLEQAERLADHTIVILEGRVADPLDAQRFLAARSFVVDGTASGAGTVGRDASTPDAAPDAGEPAAEVRPVELPPTAEGPYEDAV
jgi:putative ABC transport system ATP-binding protein